MRRGRHGRPTRWLAGTHTTESLPPPPPKSVSVPFIKLLKVGPQVFGASHSVQSAALRQGRSHAHGVGSRA